MQSKSSQVLTAAAFSMFVFTAQPSFADQVSDGAAAYGAGNYAVAKTHFLKAVAAKPKSWQAQYQLANTYIALKDSVSAKASYNKCIALHPPADIMTNCTNALIYIASNPKLTAPARPAAPIQVQMIRPKDSMPASSSTAHGGELPAPGAEGEAKSDVKPEIAAQRARIMKEADAEVEKVKAQEKERHAELESNANQRFIMPDGTVQIKLTDEEESRFQKELEQKVAQIKARAKSRADAIR